MSWIKHSQKCPHCGSKRGYAEQTNHQICFSCGYNEQTNRLIKDEKPLKRITPGIPEDFQLGVYQPWEIDYLEKYLSKDVYTRVCGHSKQYDRLIFPIYYNGEYKCWQGRSNNREPKWLICSIKHIIGYKHPYIAANPNKLPYILCEDIISMLKISQVHPAIALLGSKITKSYANFLLSLGTRFILWLDGDTAGKSGILKIKEAFGLAAEIRVIQTKYDPKEYSLERIQHFIEVLNDNISN